jgi:cell division protein FtsA
MPKDEVYCGLDIGSGRVTAVIGRINEETGGLEILSGRQSIDRDAFAAGVVKDVEKAGSVIEATITAAEQEAKVERSPLFVGIRGRFVQTYNIHAQVPITSTDRRITEEDREKVTDLAVKSLRVQSDREIIDVIPQDYVIDGQPGIKNPLGMDGNLLEIDAHAVVVSTSFLRNIEQTLAHMSLSAERISYGIIPTCEMITEREERKLGCLVIDFNGQSTGVVIYSDGHIKYSQEFVRNDIDIGSDMITRDISAYYKISWNMAEHIKQQYGVAKPSMVKKDETIEILTRDGSNRSTSRKELVQVIASRLENIFADIIIPDLQHTKLLDLVLQSGDIVITGGGANLPGITKAVADIFASECGLEIVECRIGTVDGLHSESSVSGPEDILSNHSYATAISLMRYEAADMRKAYVRTKPRRSLWDRIWKIFD